MMRVSCPLFARCAGTRASELWCSCFHAEAAKPAKEATEKPAKQAGKKRAAAVLGESEEEPLRRLSDSLHVPTSEAAKKAARAASEDVMVVEEGEQPPLCQPPAQNRSVGF